MVISGRAKAGIGALICFFLLGVVLVTGSTKGWFNPNDFNGERTAARIQVNDGTGGRIITGIVTEGVTRGFNTRGSQIEGVDGLVWLCLSSNDAATASVDCCC